MKKNRDQTPLRLIRCDAIRYEVYDEHDQIVANISLSINNVWFIFDKRQIAKLHDASYFTARTAFKALLNGDVLLS